MGEGKLTFLIGEWSSSLDPAVESRVLTDDEREMAGLLQAIWPCNLADHSTTRAWGEQGMSSMENTPCQTVHWQRRARLNKGINREELSCHFELWGSVLSKGSLVSYLITKYYLVKKKEKGFTERQSEPV